MAPTEPINYRNLARQLAGNTDWQSRFKFNDAIARPAIEGLPELVLVAAQPERGAFRGGEGLRVTAIPAGHIDEKLTAVLPMGAASWRAPDGSLSLEEIPGGGAACPRRPVALGCWDDVAGLVAERALEELDQALRGRPVDYSYGDQGLLRELWGLISGEKRPGRTRTAGKDEDTPHRVLFEERRAALGRRTEFPEGLEGRLTAKTPVLLAGMRRKHLLVVRLRRPVEPLTVGLSRPQIGPEDVLGIDPLANPFYRIAEQTSERLAQRMSLAPPDPAQEKQDADFMEMLKKSYFLSGRGAHRKFSIQNWSTRGGKTCIAVCLAMGRRPFLQQVLPEPVFIHWDLGKHPVTVFAYLVVGDDTRTNVVASDILLWCNHPSICRHAFVRRFQDGGPPHYGAVCTESTRYRLLQLHAGDKAFAPAEYLIEKLKSAERVLRYGLRLRDMKIVQHNPFANVPETEFQTVVRGYAEARKFAEQTGSEIVYFNR